MASDLARAAVTRLYSRKPKAALVEFVAAAQKADPALGEVSLRSFNATYVLPLKRRAVSKTKVKAGRPKKKAAAKKAPAKAARRKAAGPKPGVKRGRPRKAAARRAGTRRARGVSDAAQAAVRSMILERDRQVVAALGSGGDPRAAYELASGVDAYIDSIVQALRK